MDNWKWFSKKTMEPAAVARKMKSSQRSQSKRARGVQKCEACARVEVLCSACESAGAWTPPQSPPQVLPVAAARAREHFAVQSLPARCLVRCMGVAEARVQKWFWKRREQYRRYKML